MDEGYENRTIGSTLMNASSSRAHTIVTIEFKQFTIINNKQSIKSSNINLVDLAGSERSSSTGATGDRLKESISILLFIKVAISIKVFWSWETLSIHLQIKH